MWKIRKFSLQSGLALMTTRTHDRRSPYRLNHKGESKKVTELTFIVEFVLGARYYYKNWREGWGRLSAVVLLGCSCFAMFHPIPQNKKIDI